ncbi:hypothetical protein CSB07_00540 [Candidatus Gracilibacteria bacterium]|nr:MAG: hypothetical protein CSB07_00540 [Candidatus Gracilibacteria bacterium]PIE85617.1 MAG: hypothetical protein CSA08_01005 [Candidatus Gracilibacteria bacterium]
MANLTQRNIEILTIIVDEYLKTGKVMGSKLLLKKHDLGVSPATIRNDMSTLESLDLLYQPYNSAGRLPTTKGLRAFVNYLMEQTPDFFLQEKNLNTGKGGVTELADFIYRITYELAKNTKEIAFFIIPEKHICEYSGISSFLEKNHKKLGDGIYSIIKMLEDKINFSNFIENLPTNNDVNIFIGEENIIPYLKDYSIILKPITIEGKTGYIGILGSLKMKYSFNISAVRGII